MYYILVIKRTLRRRDIKMLVYNLYSVLNDQPIEIYDKNLRLIYACSSNDIPEILMSRSVHHLTALNDKEGRCARILIVTDYQ